MSKGKKEIHSHHNHHHARDDPHIWLSPDNAMVVVALIAHTLAKADLSHKPIYRANAAAMQQQLRTLKTTLAHRLRPVKHTPSLVFHDAYRILRPIRILRTLFASAR